MLSQMEMFDSKKNNWDSSQPYKIATIQDMQLNGNYSGKNVMLTHAGECRNQASAPVFKCVDLTILYNTYIDNYIVIHS